MSWTWLSINLFAALFLAFLIFQRLSELVISNRNTAKLMQRGAREYGASHYPFMVALHTGWIAVLVIFGYGQPLSMVFLAVYAVLQVCRVWILATLGERWTTRVIIIDEPLVAKGPFQFVKHPNYLLVIAEIFVVPMVLGLLWVAVLFSLLNAWMLYVRINCENKALSSITSS